MIDATLKVRRLLFVELIKVLIVDVVKIFQNVAVTNISDQNDSYEITINGFKVRKRNEMINVILGLPYGKPSSALRPKLGCSPT